MRIGSGSLVSLVGLLALGFAAGAVAQTGQWSGSGEAGFVKASGNTSSENINLGLKLDKEGAVWAHEAAITSFQSSSNNVDSADSFSADYTAKRALSDRSFLFGSLGYLDDDFDGFTEQTSAAIGYGYKVIKSEPVAWEIGVGLGYRDTAQLLTLADGSQVEGDDLSGGTLVLKSKYRNQITSNTQFVDAFKGEIGADNSFFENDAALLVAMNDRFSLKAGILVRHNTDPAPGKDETDTITSFSLVYNFTK